MKQIGDDRLEYLSILLRRWLDDLTEQIGTAVRMLASSDGEDQWWSDRIKEYMASSAAPAADRNANGEEMLLDICFWSGWLRGQRDAVEQCSLSINAIRDANTSKMVSEDRGRESANKMLDIMANSDNPAVEALFLIVSSAMRGIQPPDASETLMRFLESGSLDALIELAFTAGYAMSGGVRD
ncbi:MAG: hypothetical protein QXP70_05340 [Methanomassiliicoccales archaeon]